ncbi:hypothetical protein CDD81_5109 [Ophiocordyceps australis]|uniref:Uncharacterized protein n=1 Tax=Ophiocordyceps australis TaxID=1399860 RepID=A0A2C5YAM3_9HYPO|nr:hypothetical protein CDD81_5109 [Ophiocordyceps australis]
MCLIRTQISAACAHKCNTHLIPCESTARPYSCPKLMVSLTIRDEICPKCMAGVAGIMARLSLPCRVTFTQLSETWTLRAQRVDNLDEQKPPLRQVGYSPNVDFDARRHWVECLQHAIWYCCPHEVKVGQVVWPNIGASVMKHQDVQIAAVAEMAVMSCIRQAWDQMFLLNDDGSPVLIHDTSPAHDDLITFYDSP